MIGRNRQNIWKRVIAAGMVCLFLVNTTFQGISYADIRPGKACNSLAPNSELHGPRNAKDIARFIMEAVESLGERGRTPDEILETINVWLAASEYTLQEGSIQSVEFDPSRPEGGQFKVTLTHPANEVFYIKRNGKLADGITVSAHQVAVDYQLEDAERIPLDERSEGIVRGILRELSEFTPVSDVDFQVRLTDTSDEAFTDLADAFQSAFKGDTLSLPTVDLRPALERARVINPGLEVPFTAEQLERATPMMYADFLAIVLSEVCVPAGRLIEVNTIRGELSGVLRKTFQIVKLDMGAREGELYLGMPIWRFDMLHGTSLGSFSVGQHALVNNERARSAISTFYDHVVEHHPPAAQWLGSRGIDAASFYADNRNNIFSLHEKHHTKDRIFAWLKSDSRPPLPTVDIGDISEAILRPNSQLRSMGDAEKVATEVSAELGSAITAMEMHISEGNPDMAYAVFLFCVFGNWVLSGDQGATHRRMTQYLFTSCLRAGSAVYRTPGAIESMEVLANQYLQGGSEHPAISALRVLKRAYAADFYTEEERAEKVAAKRRPPAFPLVAFVRDRDEDEDYKIKGFDEHAGGMTIQIPLECRDDPAEFRKRAEHAILGYLFRHDHAKIVQIQQQLTAYRTAPDEAAKRPIATALQADLSTDHRKPVPQRQPGETRDVLMSDASGGDDAAAEGPFATSPFSGTNRMKMRVVRSRTAMSWAAALTILAKYREVVEQRGEPYFRLGICTGSSPIETYGLLVQLAEKGLLDFHKIKIFGMDEYAGINAELVGDMTPQHPGDPNVSYQAFLYHHLYRPLFEKGLMTQDEILNNTNLPASNPVGDEVAACNAYERKVAEDGPPHCWLVGVGTNGHVGFNEPGYTTPDCTTRTVMLTDQTRKDNTRFFLYKDPDEPGKGRRLVYDGPGGLKFVQEGESVEGAREITPEEAADMVPRKAYTVGVATFKQAESIVVIAYGDKKAGAIKGGMEEPPNNDNTLSLLQDHPDCSVFITEDAASTLATQPSSGDITAAEEEITLAARHCVRGKGNYIEGLEAFVAAGITSRDKARTREELQKDVRYFGKTTVLTELHGYTILGLVKVIPPKETPDHKPRYYLAEEVTAEKVAALKGTPTLKALESAHLDDPQLRALAPEVGEIVGLNEAEMRYIIAMCVLMRGGEESGAAGELAATVLVRKETLELFVDGVGLDFPRENYVGEWIAEFLQYRRTSHATLQRRRTNFIKEFLPGFVKAHPELNLNWGDIVATFFKGPETPMRSVRAKEERGVLARLAHASSQRRRDIARAIYAGLREGILLKNMLYAMADERQRDRMDPEAYDEMPCLMNERGEVQPLSADDHKGLSEEQLTHVIRLRWDEFGCIRVSCEDPRRQIHPNIVEAIELHNHQKTRERSLSLSDRYMRYLLAVGILSRREHEGVEKIKQPLVELLDTNMPLTYALEGLGYGSAEPERLIAASAVLYLQYLKSPMEQAHLIRINSMLREAMRGSGLEEGYFAVFAVFKPPKEGRPLFVQQSDEQVEHDKIEGTLRKIRNRNIAGLSTAVDVADVLTPGAEQPRRPKGKTGRQDAYARTLVYDRPVPVGDPEDLHQHLIDPAIEHWHKENKAVTLRHENNDGTLDLVVALLSQFCRDSHQYDLLGVLEDLLLPGLNKPYLSPHPEGYRQQISILKLEGKPICTIPIERLGEKKRKELIAAGYITEEDKVLEVYGHASDRGLYVVEMFKTKKKVTDTEDLALVLFFELLRFMGVDNELTNEVWEYLYNESFGLEHPLPEALSKRLQVAVEQNLRPKRRPGNLLKTLAGREAAMAKRSRGQGAMSRRTFILAAGGASLIVACRGPEAPVEEPPASEPKGPTPEVAKPQAQPSIALSVELGDGISLADPAEPVEREGTQYLSTEDSGFVTLNVDPRLAGGNEVIPKGSITVKYKDEGRGRIAILYQSTSSPEGTYIRAGATPKRDTGELVEWTCEFQSMRPGTPIRISAVGDDPEFVQSVRLALAAPVQAPSEMPATAEAAEGEIVLSYEVGKPSGGVVLIDKVKTATSRGAQCVTTEDAGGILSFSLDPQSLGSRTVAPEVLITVRYLDVGTDNLTVVYHSSNLPDNTYTRAGGIINKTNTGEWKEATVKATDVELNAPIAVRINQKDKWGEQIASVRVRVPPAAERKEAPDAVFMVAHPRVEQKSGVFGVNARLEIYKDAPRRMRLLRHVGIGQVRHDIRYDMIVRPDGTYDWSAMDALVAAADENDIRIFGNLLDDPAIAMAQDATSGEDERIARYAEFVKRVVSRYKDKIKFWEVWNEQDSRGFWGSQPSPENYAKLLGAVYTAAKEADPDCRIALGGLMGRPTPAGDRMNYAFLENLYALGANKYFDVVNIHVYPHEGRILGIDEGAFVRSTIDHVRGIMAANGEAGKYLVITEIGETSAQGPDRRNVSEEEQAKLLGLYYDIAREKGVGMFWHRYRDVTEAPDRPEQNYGLLRVNGEPRAALETLHTEAKKDEEAGRKEGMMVVAAAGQPDDDKRKPGPSPGDAQQGTEEGDVASVETLKAQLQEKLRSAPFIPTFSANTIEAVARASFSLVREIHRQNYDAIVISGYSAEISRILLTHTWARLFTPEVQMPPVYILSGRTNRIIYKDEAAFFQPYPLEDKIGAFKSDIGDETGEVFEKLKASKILHLDDNAGKGQKIEKLNELFYGPAGFTDVNHAVFVALEEMRTYEGPNVIIGAFDERASRAVRAFATDMAAVARSGDEGADDTMIAMATKAAKETNDMALEALREFIDRVDLSAMTQEPAGDSDVAKAGQDQPRRGGKFDRKEGGKPEDVLAEALRIYGRNPWTITRLREESPSVLQNVVRRTTQRDVRRCRENGWLERLEPSGPREGPRYRLTEVGLAAALVAGPATGPAGAKWQYCITSPSEPELQVFLDLPELSQAQEDQVAVLIDKIYDEKLGKVEELIEAVRTVMVERDPAFKGLALKQALDGHIRTGGYGPRISIDDLAYPVYLGISRSRRGRYDDERWHLTQLLYQVMAQNGLFPVEQEQTAQGAETLAGTAWARLNFDQSAKDCILLAVSSSEAGSSERMGNYTGCALGSNVLVQSAYTDIILGDEEGAKLISAVVTDDERTARLAEEKNIPVVRIGMNEDRNLLDSVAAPGAGVQEATREIHQVLNDQVRVNESIRGRSATEAVQAEAYYGVLEAVRSHRKEAVETEKFGQIKVMLSEGCLEPFSPEHRQIIEGQIGGESDVAEVSPSRAEEIFQYVINYGKTAVLVIPEEDHGKYTGAIEMARKDPKHCKLFVLQNYQENRGLSLAAAVDAARCCALEYYEGLSACYTLLTHGRPLTPEQMDRLRIEGIIEATLSDIDIEQIDPDRMDNLIRQHARLISNA